MGGGVILNFTTGISIDLQSMDGVACIWMTM
jgi:hypothetical protein